MRVLDTKNIAKLDQIVLGRYLVKTKFRYR